MRIRKKIILTNIFAAQGANSYVSPNKSFNVCGEHLANFACTENCENEKEMK